MISYTTNVSDVAPVDVFQGATSDGKWVVQITAYNVPSGILYLSPDGTVLGQQLRTKTSNTAAPVYTFVVQDQPLWLVSTGTVASTVDVTVLPYVEPEIKLGVCNC